MSFFTTALQVIMREQAVSLSVIGLLQIIKLPWILKVFWAPAVDRCCNTIVDYKRTIIGVEIIYALLILLTSVFDMSTILPSSFHLLIVIILLALMASATQDIATDALAIRTSSHQQRGLLNSMQSMGSFGGSLLGSGVLLIVLHEYSWNRVAQCLSLFSWLLFRCYCIRSSRFNRKARPESVLRGRISDCFSVRKASPGKSFS